MLSSQRLSYGWIIISICLVTMTLIYGIRHSFSVFFPPILGEFGWSRGGTAFMFSLHLLSYGLTAPVAGNLGDRWKPKIVMYTGITVIVLSTAACAVANQLWQFYLLYGFLIPAGTSFCGWPLWSPTLSNWFPGRRGLAMALGQMGAGLSFTYALFAEFAISQFGWRNAYLILSGMVVVVAYPLYSFVRYRPERKSPDPHRGGYSLASGDSTKLEDISEKSKPGDWTLKAAMQTYQLWLLVLSSLLYFGIGMYLMLAHQIIFAIDAGYSSAFAASIFALYGVFVILGAFSGFISDWIGREITVTLSTILTIGAVVALLFVKDTSQTWLLYAYAVCFGYGNGLYSPIIFAGTGDIFHGRCFGAISGLLLTGMGIGGILGPWIGGYIYDITDSYTNAFLLCITCFSTSCLAFWVAAPRNAHKYRAVRLMTVS
jgi:MFS family permease